MYDLDKISTLVVLILIIVFLIIDKIRPSKIFFIGIVGLVLANVLSIEEFLGSYTNESIISIFLLIFITSGIRDNFYITKYLDFLFGKKNSRLSFSLKLTSSVAILSSFMNNTPIVATMIPYVHNWARKNSIAPSKLFIPLSFAAIMGGMITVIGTSTNLVLNGMLIANSETPLGFFDFFWPGILVALVGILFLSFFSHYLLPNNTVVLDSLSNDQKNYFVEARLKTESNSIGKTITQAKLRNLPGLYLAEINRNQNIISPVSPDEILLSGDILIFVGDTNRVLDLLHNRKDICYAENNTSISKKSEILEVVVPSNSMLAGKTVKESKFREKYNASIIGVHRNGEKLSGKIGKIKLRYGDLLLLVIGSDFALRTEKSTDIYVVSIPSKTEKVGRKKKAIFLLIAIALISASTFFEIKLFEILLLLLILMFVFGFMTVEKVKKQFDVHLLVVLSSAVTLGHALIKTGLSDDISLIYSNLFESYGGFIGLFGLFLLTLVLTSFVTNIAAVSIVFPLAYSMSHELGIGGTPFYLAIAFAASAAFLTPVSYQTNLMVYGPGSYKFKDFVKIGIPVTILYSAIVLGYIWFMEFN